MELDQPATAINSGDSTPKEFHGDKPQSTGTSASATTKTDSHKNGNKTVATAGTKTLWALIVDREADVERLKNLKMPGIANYDPTCSNICEFHIFGVRDIYLSAQAMSVNNADKRSLIR
ncbi:hypothetical protein AMATHDRAFT_9273 [Amanita thiersii Skay4041]|uniref:Uncharacterized protein n=1 Tax=Amanita thiersii Skay4041 TaxID=703135 RepID=A0A2A9N7H8_9AGAR|nr:hypothetical protein AMATHDRAFT_9273 [Amanita thiersii Skay4041]